MFTSSDGVKLDIQANHAKDRRGAIVLWPCMTGNTSMYRLPVSEFNSLGFSTVELNPRGHGASGGQFDLDLCTRDLDECLESGTDYRIYAVVTDAEYDSAVTVSQSVAASSVAG